MRPEQWNQIISALPGAHLLQSAQWGALKAQYGWQPTGLVWLPGNAAPLVFGLGDDPTQGAGADEPAVPQPGQAVAAALLLIKPLARRLPLRLCLAYSPKGPLLDWADAPLRRRVLADLAAHARGRGAIFLKIDPDILVNRGIPGSEEQQPNPHWPAIRQDVAGMGFQPSPEQIQFKNSVLVDVNASDDELLARMKQKTRYNVRLGSKKGLAVRAGGPDDWPTLYRMYAETSLRDGFAIRDEAYYRAVWGTFAANAQPLIAEVDGEPVAAVYLFHFAGTAYYIYGMSRDQHRDKMPNYLLQYEAMRWARLHGCAQYDLWGAPDVFDESDSMWGVFRFKEGLGGWVRVTPGAWDLSTRPFWHWLYARAVPLALGLLRRLGRARTQAAAGVDAS